MKNLLNTMKSANLKGKTFAIALILVLTISSAVAILPAVNADTPPDVKTYAGITVAPNPVGVGQPVQVIMFVTYLPASQGFEFQHVAGQPYAITQGGWKGLTLTITDPNGASTTMGPYETDPSGMYQVSYTPTTVGNYTFQMSFPGALEVNVTWGIETGSPGNNGQFLYNANFLPTTSKTISLTVQQQPLTGWQSAPLPTAYWTTPINGENREWYSISGPWLTSAYNASGPFNPYTTAPTSAHIMYTQSLNPLGGLIGGDYGSLEFTRSSGFTLVAIMGGKVYYQGPTTQTGTSQLYCMNLATGQQVWSNPLPISVSFGQILDWRSLQSKVENPYLWSTGSTYNMYDAQTGRLLLSFSGASTGYVVEEQAYPTLLPGTTEGGGSGGGALLVYVTGMSQKLAADGITPVSDWIACWNSTKAMQSISNDAHVISYTAGSTIPWANGIMWNITYPYQPTAPYCGVNESYPSNFPAALVIRGITGNVLVCAKATYGAIYDSTTGASYVPVEGISASTGTLLWNVNITANPYAFTKSWLVGNGVFGYYHAESMTLELYNANTGALLYSINPMKNDFGTMSGLSSTPAYGNLYITGYDGYLHCIAANGTQLWATMSTQGGLEMPEEMYPFSGTPTVADGMVYASTAKSYETEPLYRGHCLYCFDAYTGQQLWNISGQMTTRYIADGYLLTTNAYDNQLYCFGMGQTATTVSATMWEGQNIDISGTVTDQTPTSQAQGTPAISDQWMTPWMQYLYMQQPMPTSATGVPVSIDAVDPNGNYIHIGNATSDITGNYHYTWTPPNVPGSYTIITTFAGSNSYYSSSAETSAIVVSPPAATVSPTPTPTSVADMYFMPAIAGIIVVIIIGFVVLALLMLRKRP